MTAALAIDRRQGRRRGRHRLGQGRHRHQGLQRLRLRARSQGRPRRGRPGPRRLRLRRRSARCSTGRTTSARRARRRSAAWPWTASATRSSRLVPEWTAYWLRFEDDALVHGGDGASSRRRRSGRPRTAAPTIVEHVPGVGHLRGDQPTTWARPSRRCSTSTARTRAYKPMLDQLDQGLDLVGGADGAFGWAGDTAIVVDAADGTPEGGLIVDADRRGGGRAAVHRAAHVHHPRWRPGQGVTVQRRGPTTARRSRSSTPATSASCPGMAGGRRRPAAADRQGRDRLRGDRRRRRHRLGPGLRQVTSSIPRTSTSLASNETLQEARRPGRHRDRRRPSSTSRPSAG